MIHDSMTNCFFDRTECILDLKHQCFYNKRSSALRVTLGNLGVSGIFSTEDVMDGR